VPRHKGKQKRIDEKTVERDRKFVRLQWPRSQSPITKIRHEKLRRGNEGEENQTTSSSCNCIGSRRESNVRFCSS